MIYQRDSSVITEECRPSVRTFVISTVVLVAIFGVSISTLYFVAK